MNTRLIPLSDLVAFGISRPQKSAKDPITQGLVASIKYDGLLNPITVKPHNNKFLVVDGVKRLKALILLARSSRFHKPSQKVTCIIEDSTSISMRTLKRPSLMTAPELLHIILKLLNGGHSSASIAKRYYCDIKIVDAAHAIQRLHPKVLKSFYNEAIDLEQAIALSTIPNPNAQWALLQQLGPFVSDKKVTEAIQSGESVIKTPDNQTIILPSRDKTVARRLYTIQSLIMENYPESELRIAA